MLGNVIMKLTLLAKTEPIALGAAFLVLVSAVMALLIAFGVDLTQEQQVAIYGVFAASIGLIAAWQRSQVTPVARPRDNAGRDLVPALPTGEDE